ncbi:hypothetical protein ACH50O_21010 [Methylomonas sp. 2BW1-5-20]|uniref:hypothetical protein n=1 Tax=Methylomonas sp. 2BW1-5-20 TaxID=3376686 RepID=UPI00404D54F2
MLTLKEIVPALHMAQAIGDRAYGHFDHDANAIAGPATIMTVPCSGRSSKPGTLQTASMDSFKTEEDPITGELLYYPR